MIAKKMRDILVFIPARSGSKRVKKKNIRIIKGKPLIFWTIKYAKKIIQSKQIIVSSDSRIIENISFKEKVIFIKRPKKLSNDKSDVYYSLVHALKKIKDSNKYKYVALLQPTSPIRPLNLVSEAVKILKKNKKFKNLIHLEKTNINIGNINKKNQWVALDTKSKRTQDIKNQYRPSGCLFLYERQGIEKKSMFKKRKNYGFYNKKFIKTVNIDNEEDFLILKHFLKKKDILKNYK